MTKIALDCEEMYDLSPLIGQCTQLIVLIVEKVQLTTLPSEIGRLTQLTYFKMLTESIDMSASRNWAFNSAHGLRLLTESIDNYAF